MRVLLVEDDPEWQEYLRSGLERAGVDTASASDVESARAILAGQPRGHFDAVVLDVHLPGAPGWDLLTALREGGSQIPVLFVTSEGESSSRIKGLRLGGDDYLVKPFDVAELVERLRLALRRRTPAVLEYGELRLDLARRRVWRAGEPIDVTPREFDLLLALAEARGEFIPRRRLIEQVWGEVPRSGTNLLDVHVGRLRRKLERRGRPLILNERGRGYALVARTARKR